MDGLLFATSHIYAHFYPTDLKTSGVLSSPEWAAGEEGGHMGKRAVRQAGEWQGRQTSLTLLCP